MNKLLVVILAFFSIIKASVAQDTIISIEGEKIIAKKINLNQSPGECYYFNTKGKEKEINLEDVFSIRDSTGNETVFYKQDTTKGFYETPTEMKQYIEGILAAKISYKAPKYTYGGAALSFAAVSTAVITGYGLLFWTTIVPIVYTGLVFYSKPNVAEITQTIPEPLRSEKYITGYVIEMKKKRVTNAIVGSVGGLIGSWVGFFAITGFKTIALLFALKSVFLLNDSSL